MAAGLPDLVDCARLADDAAVLERTYGLRDLPRLKDALAEPQGMLTASFAFAKTRSGRAGAKVTVAADPQLVCQRCMQGFLWRVTAGSEVEFASSAEPNADDGERELFAVENGLVSLKDLAEEEMLLALPIAPACSTPLTCGKAPREVVGGARSGDTHRPLGALQDLLKKT